MKQFSYFKSAIRLLNSVRWGDALELRPYRSVTLAIAAFLEIAGLIGLVYALTPTIDGQQKPFKPIPPLRRRRCLVIWPPQP